jgi:hypothetical protein
LEHGKITVRLDQLSAELNIDRLGYQLNISKAEILLKESQFHFERSIVIATLQLNDLSKKVDSDFRALLSTSIGNKESKPIVMKLEGRKKLHPAYTGEIIFRGDIDQLKVNFDPAFYLRVIRLFDRPSHPTNMSTNERENVILEMAHRLLTSQLFATMEQTILSSDRIANKEDYMSFDKYKAKHSCIALLKLETRIR